MFKSSGSRLSLAILTTLALMTALLAVAIPIASADHVSTWPSSSAANHADYWEQWGADQEGENDWACTKDDRGGEGAYVLGTPPEGSVWRLVVVKAGSEYMDLHWNPAAGDTFQHSGQGGWSFVISCSQPPSPIVEETTTSSVEESSTTEEEATTTSESETSPTTAVVGPTTSEVAALVTTTELNATPTTAAIEDEVLASTITAPSDTVDVSDESLPFTGFESATTGLAAMLLVVTGLITLLGAEVFRKGRHNR